MALKWPHSIGLCTCSNISSPSCRRSW